MLICGLLAACSSEQVGPDVDSSSEAPPRPEMQAGDVLVCSDDEATALYDQRIAPLLAEERPKTCNECHLSGIDLGMVIKDTPCQTMACMVEQDLVDLQNPQASLVLSWIERADPASPLITEEVIAEEYNGFLVWIEYHAACGSTACEPVDNPCGDTTPPGPDACPIEQDSDGEEPGFDDPGDCSDRTLEALFQDKVYAWRGRCFPCHFDSSKIEAPKWITTGNCNASSLATMRNVLDRGLLNYQAPSESLLLLKPLSEDEGGVMHGGHDKFASIEDQAYLDIREWIERKTACEGQ